MKPLFSLEECLKRYLHDLNVWLQLEEGSSPIAESRKDWKADIAQQKKDIVCVKYWLERVQSREAI